jgi:hypothetical protein
MTPLGGGRSGTDFAALDIQGWEPDGRAFQPAELFARGTQGRVLKAVDRPVPTDPTGERLAFDVKNAKVSALGPCLCLLQRHGTCRVSVEVPACHRGFETDESKVSGGAKLVASLRFAPGRRGPKGRAFALRYCAPPFRRPPSCKPVNSCFLRCTVMLARLPNLATRSQLALL